MRNILVVILILFTVAKLNAQVKGVVPEDEKKDSVYVFKSPRPLLTYEDLKKTVTAAFGGDLTLSDSGFGVGLFYEYFFSNDFAAFISLYISGKRNSDEFDNYNPDYNTFQVYNKINRLYVLPLTVGVQQFLFQDKLSESLKPYWIAGVGPGFIISAPYTYGRQPNAEMVGWFKSFGDADFYVKPNIMIGIGSYFGSILNSIIGASIKYYYIPFGGDGLESVKDLPITNFGGIYLSLTLGTTF